jgi:hypothetical protein
LLLRQVGRERRSELRLVEHEKPVLWRQYRRDRSSRRRILDERRHGFAFVRRKRRDVDEPGDLGIVARFGNHHAAVRVPDENNGAVRTCDGALRRSHVIGERCSRVLDDGYGIALFLEQFVDLLPTRSVDESSVYQYD